MKRLALFSYGRHGGIVSFVPNLMRNVLKANQEILNLNLDNLMFEDETLKNYMPALKKVKDLVLVQNNLTDESLSIVLEPEIASSMLSIKISKQPLMTSKSLESWRNQILHC